MTWTYDLMTELAQDALVIALQRWPESGVPEDPGPWLMATAKHRAIDALRRRSRYEHKLQVLGRELETRQESGGPDVDAALDDHVGDDWVRPALCEEALRLGRILAGLMPDQAEVHGLVALMEIQASHTRARTGPAGEPVLLGDQDRRLWDRLLIRRGLAALDRAEALGGGPYTLQAAIAACHAGALEAADTDWERIAALYQVLAHVSPSPVVELNRAVAVGMAAGPAKGLEVVDALVSERALDGYALLPAVRGDLLARLGRDDEARRSFEQAAALTRNERERTLFLDRAAALRP